MPTTRKPGRVAQGAVGKVERIALTLDQPTLDRLEQHRRALGLGSLSETVRELSKTPAAKEMK